MTVSGNRTSGRDMALLSGTTATSTKATGTKTKKTATAGTNGPMATDLLGNGKTIKSTGRASSSLIRTATWESGPLISAMATESATNKMVKSTKGSGKTTSDMEEAFATIKTAVFRTAYGMKMSF